MHHAVPVVRKRRGDLVDLWQPHVHPRPAEPFALNQLACEGTAEVVDVALAESTIGKEGLTTSACGFIVIVRIAYYLDPAQMDARQAEPLKRLEYFTQGLKRSGIKLTKQRREILHEVAVAHDHPDAETIYRGVRERVPAVSLDTVYRTLWLLADLGLVTALVPPRDRVRFDANIRPHHHFVCTSCGVRHDFYSAELDRLPIPDAVQALGSVKTTQVEVRGICTQCAKERDSGSATG